ncbi:MAP1D [Scenedesmus sp. PABB004]|nr:MAP1D [Scenedesmus sp. PABB004]
MASRARQSAAALLARQQWRRGTTAAAGFSSDAGLQEQQQQTQQQTQQQQQQTQRAQQAPGGWGGVLLASLAGRAKRAARSSAQRRPAAPLAPAAVSPERAVPPHIARPPYALGGAVQGGLQCGLSRRPEVHDAEGVAAMRAAGRLAARALRLAGALVAPGVSTDAIDAAVHEYVVAAGAYPSPLRYHGFPKSICTSVNEVVCHGIPDARPLAEGDVVNVDVTAYLGGHHGDTNATFYVGEPAPAVAELVEATRAALDAGIAVCGPGVPFRAIGHAIHRVADAAGLGLVRDFVGHGIGRAFHAAPAVLHHRNVRPGAMEVGQTFTIEPILTLGGARHTTWRDGWTVVTADGSYAAQFEHTLLVTHDGVEVLTALPADNDDDEAAGFLRRRRCPLMRAAGQRDTLARGRGGWAPAAAMSSSSTPGASGGGASACAGADPPPPGGAANGERPAAAGAARHPTRHAALEAKLQRHMDREDARVKAITEGVLGDLLPAALSAVLPRACEDPLHELTPQRCRAVGGAALAAAALMNAPPGFLEFLLCIPWHQLPRLCPPPRGLRGGGDGDDCGAPLSALAVDEAERRALVNTRLHPQLVRPLLDFMTRQEHADSVPPVLRAALLHGPQAQQQRQQQQQALPGGGDGVPARPAAGAAAAADGEPLDTVAALLDGATPLHCAALRGNPAQVDLLLFSGADPTLRTAAGELPLQLVPACCGFDRETGRRACHCLGREEQEVRCARRRAPRGSQCKGGRGGRGAAGEHAPRRLSAAAPAQVWECRSRVARSLIAQRCLLAFQLGVGPWLRLAWLCLLALVGFTVSATSLQRPVLQAHVSKRQQQRRQDQHARRCGLLARMRDEAAQGRAHLAAAKQRAGFRQHRAEPPQARRSSGEHGSGVCSSSSSDAGLEPLAPATPSAAAEAAGGRSLSELAPDDALLNSSAAGGRRQQQEQVGAGGGSCGSAAPAPPGPALAAGGAGCGGEAPPCEPGGDDATELAFGCCVRAVHALQGLDLCGSASSCDGSSDDGSSSGGSGSGSGSEDCGSADGGSEDGGAAAVGPAAPLVVPEDEQAEVYCCWAESVLLKFEACGCAGCTALAVQAVRSAHAAAAQLNARVQRGAPRHARRAARVGAALGRVVHAHIALLVATDARTPPSKATVWRAQQCLQEWDRLVAAGLAGGGAGAEAAVGTELVAALRAWARTAESDLLIAEALLGACLGPVTTLEEALAAALLDPQRDGGAGGADRGSGAGGLPRPPLLARPVSAALLDQLQAARGLATCPSPAVKALAAQVADATERELSAGARLRELLQAARTSGASAESAAALAEAIAAAQPFASLGADMAAARALHEQASQRAAAAAALQAVVDGVVRRTAASVAAGGAAAPPGEAGGGEALAAPPLQGFDAAAWERGVAALEAAAEAAREAGVGAGVIRARKLVKELQAQAAAADAAGALDACMARRPCGSGPLRAAVAKAEAAAAAVAGASGGAAGGAASAAFSDALLPRLQAARRRLEVERSAEALHRACLAHRSVAELPRLEAAILNARKVGAEELAPEEYRAASELRARLTAAARVKQQLDAALRGLAAASAGSAGSAALDALAAPVEAAMRDARRCEELLPGEAARAADALAAWRAQSTCEARLCAALRDGVSSSALSRLIAEATAAGVKVAAAPRRVLKAQQLLEAAATTAADEPGGAAHAQLAARLDAAEQAGVAASALEPARRLLRELAAAEAQQELEAALKPHSDWPASRRIAALRAALDKAEEVLGLPARQLARKAKEQAGQQEPAAAGDAEQPASEPRDDAGSGPGGGAGARQLLRACSLGSSSSSSASDASDASDASHAGGADGVPPHVRAVLGELAARAWRVLRRDQRQQAELDRERAEAERARRESKERERAERAERGRAERDKAAAERRAARTKAAERGKALAVVFGSSAGRGVPREAGGQASRRGGAPSPTPAAAPARAATPPAPGWAHARSDSLDRLGRDMLALLDDASPAVAAAAQPQLDAAAPAGWHTAQAGAAQSALAAADSGGRQLGDSAAAPAGSGGGGRAGAARLGLLDLGGGSWGSGGGGGSGAGGSEAAELLQGPARTASPAPGGAAPAVPAGGAPGGRSTVAAAGIWSSALGLGDAALPPLAPKDPAVLGRVPDSAAGAGGDHDAALRARLVQHLSLHGLDAAQLSGRASPLASPDGGLGAYAQHGGGALLQLGQHPPAAAAALGGPYFGLPLGGGLAAAESLQAQAELLQAQAAQLRQLHAEQQQLLLAAAQHGASGGGGGGGGGTPQFGGSFAFGAPGLSAFSSDASWGASGGGFGSGDAALGGAAVDAAAALPDDLGLSSYVDGAHAVNGAPPCKAVRGPAAAARAMAAPRRLTLAVAVLACLLAAACVRSATDDVAAAGAEERSPPRQQQQLGGSAKAAPGGAKPNYGPAYGCTPPTLPPRATPGAPIPALPAGARPNIIVVLTDDQGYDDIGLHQPQPPGGRPTWVNTPNIDAFLRGSTEFDNFYVSPMCSQTRAMLLTGRDYQRTGTMLINGGYDYINRAEVTAGELFAAAGYDTAHFGKWHNGRTLGYEPWEVGFQESWLPSSHVHLDNLMRHNGAYVQTKGLMEQDLMDKVIGYLKQHEAPGAKPFFMYYAPHAIHQGFMRPGQGPRWQRPAPEPYKSKYKNMTPKLPGDTAEVWAMLEYMDDVLGRLFDFINASPLRDNTYVLLMSDNGAELFPTERRGRDKLRRMPSGMQGYKKSVEEGGVRNFLAVRGPGVQAGVIDSTLLSITDVLPTVAGLAGAGGVAHLPWDGLSFQNLLLVGAGRPAASLRGTRRASAAQLGRYVMEMGPQCWSPDSVPALGPDRTVLKPQPLLDYDTGGVDGQGFARCFGVRYKDFKWLGATGKVYRLPGASHIELPCNEVGGAEGDALAAQLSAAARRHFGELVSDHHSFNKPTFFLGLGEWGVTNVLPDGAHERTPGRVQLLPNGAAGFSRVGDSACFALDVVTGGRYKVAVMYTSQVQATFKLSVGEYAKIQDGAAPSLAARLPAARTMRTVELGALDLPASAGRRTEACLVLAASSAPGTPVFENLANLRFSLQGRATRAGGASAAAPALDRGEETILESGAAQRRAAKPAGAAAKPPPPAASARRTPVYAEDWLAQDSVLDTWDDLRETRRIHANLNATAAMEQAQREAYEDAARRRAAGAAKESLAVGPGGAKAAAWERLRSAYAWPAGQAEQESLFSPYDSEGIDACAQCQPEL